MGWVSFQSHAAVAGNDAMPRNDRSWALRSCCYSVSALVHGVVDTEELTVWIARTAGAGIERRENGKVVIVSKISESLQLLTRLRETLLLHLAEYARTRRALKRSGHTFPVKQPFSREMIVELLS